MEPQILDETCRCKFREKTNVSPFLVKDWQLVNGLFSPSSIKIGKCYHLRSDRVQNAADDINNKKYKLICINDTSQLSEWEEAKTILSDSFNHLFPNKSKFEI